MNGLIRPILQGLQPKAAKVAKVAKVVKVAKATRKVRKAKATERAKVKAKIKESLLIPTLRT